MTKKDRRPDRRSPHATIVRGLDSFTMTTELARSPLPSQEYEADVLWPMERLGAVSFVLDRVSLRDPSRVEARVEVRIPFESFLVFYASTQAEPFVSNFRKWLTASSSTAANSDNTASSLQNEGPDIGRVVVRAHVVRLSHVGSDAELSFYAIPASHLADAIKDQDVKTVPLAGVLRVTTTTRALAGLLSACAPLGEEIKRKMSKEEEPD